MNFDLHVRYVMNMDEMMDMNVCGGLWRKRGDEITAWGQIIHHIHLLSLLVVNLQVYLSFSVSVFVENGVGADEDKNPDAHGEGPEHPHPLRVSVLLQEPRESAPSLLGGLTCTHETTRGRRRGSQT